MISWGKMIDKAFFTDNRARVALQCDGVVVLTAYASVQLTGDMAVPFHQESNFWYLTGIEESGWQLVITPQKSWLIAPDVSEIHRVFDGGLSFDEAQRISGVDEVVDAKEGKELLVTLAAKYKTAYSIDRHPHQKYFSFTPNPAPAKLWRSLMRRFRTVHDMRRLLSTLRAIKQPVEVDAIRQAVDLTVEAFSTIKPRLPQLTHENQIEAEFTHAFRYGGARHAYDPIVASGRNACTLHYLENSAKLNRSDMVLLDIGAQIGGYSADITRTYAVGGALSDRQRAVHEAVCRAHNQIIDLLHPGLTFAEYQQRVDAIMMAELETLDLIHGDSDYRRYFPHAISHGLGVDVHDSLGGFETFQPGMVLTVEPGIYIPEESIGVRLEDNILITDTGSTNFSKALSLEL